ncbi:hypothetical protein AVCANL277_09080, partial [Campylobacter canadensis]|uniref:hypothetical protein n=1 Tax=Campylobacter canadensis TaxID=449520 RepID=UPI001CCA4E26
FDKDGKAYTKTTSAAAADKHLFFTNKEAQVDDDGTKNTGQIAVDFSKSNTWGGGGTDADTNGKNDAKDSILNKNNMFDDVKKAYYEQAARHAADGYERAKDITITEGAEIDLSSIHANIQGALHLAMVVGEDADETAGTTTAAGDNGKDTYKQWVADANDAIKKVAGQETSKHNSLQDLNAAIDDAVNKLTKVIDAAAGKTMADNEGENGIAAYAALNFLKGLKEGLNEPNRSGLKDIIGLTDENKTNFGRLSLSSNNGRDIVVQATTSAVDDKGKPKEIDVTS